MHLPEVIVKGTYSSSIPSDRKAIARTVWQSFTYQCMGIKSILQPEQKEMKLESHARPFGELLTAGAPKRMRWFRPKG